MSHNERKSELTRRRQRRNKLSKLKSKLGRAKNPGEANTIQQKIKKISPLWQPAGK